MHRRTRKPPLQTANSQAPKALVNQKGPVKENFTGPGFAYVLCRIRADQATLAVFLEAFFAAVMKRYRQQAAKIRPTG